MKILKEFLLEQEYFVFDDHIINEMSMKGGDFSAPAERFARHHETQWADGKHVGDIDEFSVNQDGIYYSVWDGEELIACASADTLPTSYTIVDHLWVETSYRGQNIISKLLWFLKTREGYDKLMFGKVHSSDTYNFLKQGGLSKFKKTWHRGEEIEPFSPETIDDFYGIDDKKDWQLVLEGDLSAFSDFPRFRGDADYWATECYDWQIE